MGAYFAERKVTKNNKSVPLTAVCFRQFGRVVMATTTRQAYGKFVFHLTHKSTNQQCNINCPSEDVSILFKANPTT